MKTKLQSCGFSLVELLLVVAIISILFGVGVPQFFSYRKRALDAALKVDLRNARTLMEAQRLASGELPQSINSLPLSQSENTILEMATDDDGILIRARAKTGCAEGTGIWNWHISSGAGDDRDRIEGIPCR